MDSLCVMWLVSQTSSAGPRRPGSESCRDDIGAEPSGDSLRVFTKALSPKRRAGSWAKSSAKGKNSNDGHAPSPNAGFVRGRDRAHLRGFHVPVFCHESDFCSAIAPIFFENVRKPVNHRELCRLRGHARAALRRGASAKNSSRCNDNQSEAGNTGAQTCSH